MAVNPAFVFVLSVLLLGERLTLTRALGLGLSFLGLLVVERFASGRQVDFCYVRGVLIALMAPVAGAVCTVVGRSVAARKPALASTGVGATFGTLPILCPAKAPL